jgi:hypothetical protein
MLVKIGESILQPGFEINNCLSLQPKCAGELGALPITKTSSGFCPDASGPYTALVLTVIKQKVGKHWRI